MAEARTQPLARPPLPKPGRSSVLPLVVGAHLLLLAGLWRLLPPPERVEAAAPRVGWLRLLPELPPRTADRPAAPAAPRGTAAPRRPVQAELQAPAAAALPAAAPTTAEPAAPAPLQLTLPRGGSARIERSPALDDARANTPRPSLEARIAKTLEKDWTEELLPDGSRRFRRGNDCIIVKDSRATVLDPFNQASRMAPKLAGPC